MKPYVFILNILGYSLFRKPNEVNDDPVDIEIGKNGIMPKIKLMSNSNVNPNISTIEDKIKMVFKYFYNLVIFVLISWSIVYAIILTIRTSRVDYIGGYMFQIIFLTQYAFGLKYFSSDHLFTKLADNKKMEKQFDTLMILTLVVSIILATASTTCVALDIDISPFSVMEALRQHMSTGVIALLFFDRLFGYLAFLTNASTFVTIMLNHKNEIVEYTNGIKEFMESSVPISDKVSRISVELIDLRERFNDSVEHLNLLFSSLSILGMIDIFFVIEFWVADKLNSMDIINLATFLFIEYFYINSAQKLRESINKISSDIKLPIYMNNYLQRNTLNRKIPIFANNNEKVIFDTLVHTQIYVVELIEYQSLQQLQIIINEEWSCFEIFGIKLNDTTLMQKLIGLIFTIFIAGNLTNIIAFQI